MPIATCLFALLSCLGAFDPPSLPQQSNHGKGEATIRREGGGGGEAGRRRRRALGRSRSSRQSPQQPATPAAATGGEAVEGKDKEEREDRQEGREEKEAERKGRNKNKKGSSSRKRGRRSSWQLAAEQQEQQLSTQRQWQQQRQRQRRLRLHLRLPGAPTKNRALSEPPSQSNSPAELAVLVLVPDICPLGHFQLALRALDLRAAPCPRRLLRPSGSEGGARSTCRVVWDAAAAIFAAPAAVAQRLPF